MQQPFSRTGFERTAKRRQQVFRNESRTVSAEGKHSKDDKVLRNPHLLALGYEEENLYPSIRVMGAVDFFGQRNIKWWKSARSGEDTSVDAFLVAETISGRRRAYLLNQSQGEKRRNKILEMNGESYRLKRSRENAASQAPEKPEDA